MKEICVVRRHLFPQEGKILSPAPHACGIETRCSLRSRGSRTESSHTYVENGHSRTHANPRVSEKSEGWTTSVKERLSLRRRALNRITGDYDPDQELGNLLVSRDEQQIILSVGARTLCLG